MAELMCPGCKSDLDAGQPYCPTCMLTGVAKPEPAEPAEPPADTTALVPVVEENRAGPACDDPDCAHGGVPPPQGCRHCGRGLAAAPRPARDGGPVALVFPWGEVPLPAGGTLLVGRENSPLARELAAYSNVSRRHAEIRADGAGVTVTDLDSANGTFVNEQRIPPRVPVPARAGDQVRFAAGLVVRVRQGSPG